jgi:hypothetical protein
LWGAIDIKRLSTNDYNDIKGVTITNYDLRFYGVHSASLRINEELLVRKVAALF